MVGITLLVLLRVLGPTVETLDSCFSDKNEVDNYLTSTEAMGFLEGYATYGYIRNFYLNLYNGLFGDGGDPKEEC